MNQSRTDLSDRQAAALWAYELVHGADGFVILDSETTGLNRYRPDEACQIAVIDHHGVVLLDTLVKPTLPIEPGASAVHGITDEMVKDAPTFEAVFLDLAAALGGQKLVVYNAEYDTAILENMLAEFLAGDFDGFKRDLGVESITCAMEKYAAFYGDWNPRYGSYRWQRLEFACAQMRVGPIDAPAHSALGDCLRTLAVIQKMAEAWTDERSEPS